MMDFAGMLEQCNYNGVKLLGAKRINQICREQGYRWRNGKLPPATTVLGMMQQVTHRNVSCSAVGKMHDGDFTAEAFCQAKKRLLLSVLLELNVSLSEAVMHKTGEVSGKWKARHRVFVIDGSGFLVPDTEELRKHFGLRRNQKPGCSYPTCHLLLQLGPGGAATAAVCSPYRTGDMTHVAEVQDTIQAGDVVLGDRLFSNWGHFILLKNRKAHGLFKTHHSRKIEFGRYKNHGPNRRWIKKLGHNDQLVEYRKPRQKPDWMCQAEFDAAPEWITVREMKVKVRVNKQRKQVRIVTTLLDEKKYTPVELIELLGQRWTIETNLRHLKTFMGLEQARCKTVAGVKKELAAYLLVYNVVRLVMLRGAQVQKVEISRISFADAMAWVRFNPQTSELCTLRINPMRPERFEPRRIKKKNSFPTLHKPRQTLRQEMVRKRLVA